MNLLVINEKRGFVGDGTGGESVYGGFFDDEGLDHGGLKHTCSGMVSMTSTGPNTNNRSKNKKNAVSLP